MSNQNTKQCDICGQITGKSKHTCPSSKLLSDCHKGQIPWNKGFKYKGEYPKCIDCQKTLSKKSYIRCRHCSNKYRSGNRGSNWRGGITPIKKLEREKFGKEIRKLVFERDNYTCRICGAKNGEGKDVYLQVDHIQPWAEYVEGRFDINNCRTLCMACHYEITFGRKMPEKITLFGFNKKTRRKIWQQQ